MIRPRITRGARPRQFNQNSNVVAVVILVKAIDQVRARNRQAILTHRQVNHVVFRTGAALALT